MSEVRTIEINESVFAANDKEADMIRDMLSSQDIFFVNVMSSPGSGKTTFLTALINMLKGEMRIAEMDVDIKTDLDAKKVADATGIRCLQIHNGGLCHIDADMTSRAIAQFGVDDIDLLILENIGNLVCPAEFDTGAHKNIMLFSVPEGDDKPLKYPLMYEVSDVVIITKLDTKEFFDFDVDLAISHIRELNPNAIIFQVSAKTGEGMQEVADYFRKNVTQGKKGK